VSRNLPFDLDVARGAVDGMSSAVVYGENADVDILTAPEDVWDPGGVYVYTASGGVPHYISSSDNGDTQDVRGRLLSEDASGDWNAETFTFALVGQTKTLLVTPSGDDPVRILSIENIDATSNAGDVYVYENDTPAGGVPPTAAKIRAKMLAGLNKTLMALYTIPSDKTGFLLQAHAMLVSDTAAKPILSIFTRPVGGVFRLLDRVHLELSGLATWQYKWKSPPVIDAQTDIRWTVTSTDADNTAIGAGFELQIKG